MWQLKILSLWKAYFEVYPWGVVLRVPHQWLLDTHRWDQLMLLPHINYGMPILHFGEARRSGGCRYCHTAPWKRAMCRLAHGLTRSRGVTRGHSDLTSCGGAHLWRTGMEFRSSPLPPISPSCRWLQTHRGHGAVVVATCFSSSGMRDQQISPSWSK